MSPSPPSTSAHWQPPTQFDEYRLVRPLGRGSTALVFLAHDTLLERAVAVKFLPAADRTALARFLNEARAAARVQHPNLVTLYRVGQVENYAYLVSEYTPGVSLDQVKKPVLYERALKVGRDLARGLAAVHRRGVLHRDLKPGNVIVTETGQAKLLDFGLAKLDKRSTGPEPALELEHNAPEAALSPVGTPYYMAPEAWGVGEHTVRSDLYSLGAVLYELCCGRAPFRHVPFSALPQTVQQEEARPLRELAPEVDGALAAAVERCLRRDPAERYASAEELLDVLEQVGAAEPHLPVPEGNPYRGLSAFEAEHRAFFFGRAREVRAVLERLRSTGFLLLTGDSGVGKSSLCAAGVLPAFVEGAMGDGRRWESRRMVPGRHPLTALALALAPSWGESAEALVAQMMSAPEALTRRVREVVGSAAGLILYVDQMEELVTLSAPDEAHPFAEAIAPLAQGLPGVRVVATARSDFLTRLAGLPGLGRQIAGALHLVPPLGPEEVREAIVGPARVKGVRFESEALVNSLVDSAVAAGGGLPLLQFALAEMWEGRARDRHVIPAAALEALGGVSGALARHADGVVDALPAEQQRAARALLLRLVTDDGTRARRSAEELCGEDARYHAALEALVRGRLLVARETQEGSTFEMAHEALLHGWSTLARWLAEEAETRQVRQRLETTAREWVRTGYSTEALWGERALQEAQVLDPDSLPERERRFLEASRAELRRRRRHRQALAAGFLLSLLLAVGVVRLRGALERDHAAEEELTTARGFLDVAAQGAQAQAQAEQVAFQAFDTGRLRQAEEAWTEAQRQAVEVDANHARAGEALERALALTPEREDVRRLLADVLLTRAGRAEAAAQERLRDVLASRLRIVDTEGERWARWMAPALLEVVKPAGAHLRVQRYVPVPGGALSLEEVPAGNEGGALRLDAGSYLLSLSAGGADVRLPVVLERGERRQVQLAPPAVVPPPGFVYVPPGRFLFGSAADESVRQFFNAAPQHPVETKGYLIGRYEVTWAEYLAFLEALPPDRREQHLPHAGSTKMYGSLELTRGADGKWVLAIQPTTERLVAREGERLRYPGRKVRAEVAWEQLPVVGIRYADAQAYAAWLASSGRVPGARLCTELEWERAARGADGREYPHGNRLLPDEANFDLTYGKEPLAFGPDEVGSHPASASPFGVEDLAGNVWEWADSVLTPGAPVARGSSYYFSASTCRSTNREAPESSFRDVTVGMRVCADIPGEPGAGNRTAP